MLLIGSDGVTIAKAKEIGNEPYFNLITLFLIVAHPKKMSNFTKEYSLHEKLDLLMFANLANI